ncbi:MAG TPA: hypothetical protein VFG98_12470 [Intrasporangium sp.]|nr:hypothetical protein [Intrasporangium sp.]
MDNGTAVDQGPAGTVRQVALVLGVFAVAGLAGAFLWYWWWSPAPEGVAFGGEVYFEPDQEFRSTGMFVAIAVPLGLVLSMVFTLLLDRDEVVTLLAVVAGACLATGLMLWVGHLLGPGSPEEAARQAADLEEVAAGLRAQPLASWLTMPGAALVGSVTILLSFSNRRLHREPDGYAPRRR